MSLRFTKYEGLGNDFIVVDAGAVADVDVAALCDRHLGIGADGVLVLDSKQKPPLMQVINADGSTPEMCGNGLRCAALHLVRTGVVKNGSFDVGTDAGLHLCEVEGSGPSAMVRIGMRAPSFEPRDVPVQSPSPWIDETLVLGERTVRATAVSFGNPHVVIFDDVGEARFQLGPLVQRDPRLAHGANVGFAKLVRPDLIELHVLERGVGWTQACGTGACAAAAAAVETGRAARNEPLRVSLPGGDLVIQVGGPGEPTTMRGPARFVFEGALAD